MGKVHREKFHLRTAPCGFYICAGTVDSEEYVSTKRSFAPILAIRRVYGTISIASETRNASYLPLLQTNRDDKLIFSGHRQLTQLLSRLMAYTKSENSFVETIKRTRNGKV
ncbi:hypothetical protein Zmor_024921 [Zophobas morio]|uniref:Uncharacterized protein n=1 Tax=Zophobas morio TaxID=2755281 RepID=A0AA38HSU3_9CUCU|nr:hypothetical protein Zmor_024921 [Zophobas morio]